MSDEKWPHVDLAIRWYSAPPGTYEWRARLNWPSFEWSVDWIKDAPPRLYGEYEYEIRPIRRMQILPQAEVPAPLRERPRMEEMYWTIDFDSEGGATEWIWSDDLYDKTRFRIGWCWATKEDAEANLKAMTARRDK